MKRVRTSNEKGITLIEILVTSVVMVTVVYGFLTFHRDGGKVQAGLTANNDLTQLVVSLRTILEHDSSCAKSGLVGTTVNPLSPGAVAIAIRAPGSLGPAGMVAQEAMAVGTRRITFLRFTSMTKLTTSAYFATLTLRTALNADPQAQTRRSPDTNLFLNVTLDSANKIVSCAISSQSVNQAQIYSGVVSTGYFNNADHSVPVWVAFPAACPNPVVITQSLVHSLNCSDGAGKLAACPSDPNGNSQDVHSYIEAVTPLGFSVILSGQSVVCVAPIGTTCAGSSPAYPISYLAVCNP